MVSTNGQSYSRRSSAIETNYRICFSSVYLSNSKSFCKTSLLYTTYRHHKAIQFVHDEFGLCVLWCVQYLTLQDQGDEVDKESAVAFSAESIQQFHEPSLTIATTVVWNKNIQHYEK